jgi:hypothetical protein
MRTWLCILTDGDRETAGFVLIAARCPGVALMQLYEMDVVKQHRVLFERWQGRTQPADVMNRVLSASDVRALDAAMTVA